MSAFTKTMMAMAVAVAGAAANASTVFNYDSVVTGATPNSTAPWLTVTLDDGTNNSSNGVFMKIDTSLESSTEFVGTLLFNLDPGFTEGTLSSANVYQTSGDFLLDMSWTVNYDHYGAAGVKLDLQGDNDHPRLNGNHTWTFFFSGFAEEDFQNGNGPLNIGTKRNPVWVDGPWTSLAHVQGIGEGDCSGWIGASNSDNVSDNVTQTFNDDGVSCGSPPEVPLPGTLGLLGLGLAGLGALRRKQPA